MAEVKRAYRRLAKAYHPDSAGEQALPRFLAIHEAYERLVTGRSRAGGGPRAARTASPTPPAEPWRADPERAKAARERARAGRGSTGTRPRSGSQNASSGGRAGTGTSGGSGAGTRDRRRRNVRKATMGSTSYDEAREVTDATWSGASWYGPTSGEYWIVNPREYADPRKHGPTYQQRARRTAAAGATTGTESGAPEDIGEPVAEEPAVASASAGSAAGPAVRGASRDQRSWDASARPGWMPYHEAAAAAADRAWRDQGRRLPGDGAPAAGTSGPLGSFGAVGRDLLGTASDDPIRRLGLALVAWPPLGLAAAAAIGDLTGCTTYSAACSGSDTLLPWLAQAAIVGLLLLLPPLARLFVGGTIAVLLALVPVTAFLVVVGAGGAPQAAFALGALLAAAWIGGVGYAARGSSRAVA
jgi:curved DNA-binding protein CbpA